jgi:4,5-dihydroxyphthalate decarboxylase
MRDATPEITVATWDHDRTTPVLDGRVAVQGFRVAPTILPTTQLFPIAVQEARFDVTELSLSSLILQISRGEGAYVAIPAFISRAFRHNGFYRRAGSGIETPADFRGRTIGVPEYQMTAALWMRAIMADDYGVAAHEVRWRTGALDAGVRRERLALTPPPELVIEPIAEGETLQDLLLRGEIDGLLAPNPPKAFLAGDPRIERVFPDFEAAEVDYARRTGFFPIMHVVAVRRTLAEAHPELPRALFDAFSAAKDMAQARLRETWLGSANRLSLPWLNGAMERTRAALGEDWYRYGFRQNRAEVVAMCRHSVAQHLAARLVQPEEIFHPALLET